MNKIPKNMDPKFVNRRKWVKNAIAVTAAGIAGSTFGIVAGDDLPKSEDPKITCDIEVGNGNSFNTNDQVGESVNANDGMKHLDINGQPVNPFDRGHSQDKSTVVYEGDHFIARNVDEAICRSVGGTVLGAGPQG